MGRWNDAVRTYRRLPLEGGHGDGNPVMFVLCSESHAATPLVAAFEPAMVLQTFGGVRSPADPGVFATIELAVRTKGVRHLVVCGHEGCLACAEASGDARASTQKDAVAQLRALHDDERVGPLLRSHGVSLRALWFDEREGDVYACDVEEPGRAPLDDEDLAALRVRFEGRAA